MEEFISPFTIFAIIDIWRTVQYIIEIKLKKKKNILVALTRYGSSRKNVGGG